MGQRYFILRSGTIVIPSRKIELPPSKQLPIVTLGKAKMADNFECPVVIFGDCPSGAFEVRDGMANAILKVITNSAGGSLVTLKDTDIDGDLTVQDGVFAVEETTTNVKAIEVQNFGYESPDPPAIEPRMTVALRQGLVAPWKNLPAIPPQQGGNVYDATISDISIAPNVVPYTINVNPSFVQDGQIFIIKSPPTTDTEFYVTIQPGGGYTIDGQANLILDTPNQVVWIQRDETNTNWQVI